METMRSWKGVVGVADAAGCHHQSIGRRWARRRSVASAPPGALATDRAGVKPTAAGHANLRFAAPSKALPGRPGLPHSPAGYAATESRAPRNRPSPSPSVASADRIAPIEPVAMRRPAPFRRGGGDRLGARGLVAQPRSCVAAYVTKGPVCKVVR